MKKTITLSILLLIVAVATFAQVTDTTGTVVYAFGDSLAQFFSKNMWTLFAIAFAIVSEWLGQTGKVKEGSIYAWLLNLVGNIIKNKGKAEVIPTKKAYFMSDKELMSNVKGIYHKEVAPNPGQPKAESKDHHTNVGKKPPHFRTILLIIALSVLGMTASAQGLGLFSKPSAENFTVKMRASNLKGLSVNGDSILASLNKWDLATGVNAMSINLKTGELGTFNSAGFGIVYSGYKLKSDGLTVYKTFSAGGMLLFGNTNQNSLFDPNKGESPAEPAKADFGIMGIVGVGPVSMGPVYFIVSKTMLLNLQVTFTF